ncbi:MAG TPA: hypothetical protein VFL57_18130 [Bryobacteraceae bacterium]|nr:hypothetical protein [Bryobacteraceae bacterium]
MSSPCSLPPSADLVRGLVREHYAPIRAGYERRQRARVDQSAKLFAGVQPEGLVPIALPHTVDDELPVSRHLGHEQAAGREHAGHDGHADRIVGFKTEGAEKFA